MICIIIYRNQLTEEFPTGLIEPFSIIIPAKIPTDPKETATVLTKDFFTATNGLIRQLVSDGIVQPSGIVSPTYINGTLSTRSHLTWA